MTLEIRPVGAANLPDAARLCLAGKSLSDRPRAFTRETEQGGTRCKLAMLRPAMAAGAAAFAAYRSGMLVGYAEGHPVERAPDPVDGAGFLVLHCLRVPEEAERAEVEGALVAALAAKSGGGLAVLAREKDWSAHGFEVIARGPSEVGSDERVLWGLGPETAHARIVPVERKFAVPAGKVRVDLFTSDRCPWDRYVFDLVRGVCAARKAGVALFETDCNARREVLRWGVVSAVAVNGRHQPWVRPWRLPDEHAITMALDDAE